VTVTLNRHHQIKLDVDGIFVEMGYISKTDFVKDLVQVNEQITS
jgi:thioredoxin reductase